MSEHNYLLASLLVLLIVIIVIAFRPSRAKESFQAVKAPFGWKAARGGPLVGGTVPAWGIWN